MKKRFKKRELSSGLRNLLILFCIVGAGFGLLVMLNEYSHDIKTVSHTEFMRLVEQDEVKKVHVSGGQVEGRLKDGSHFETMIVNTPSTWDTLTKHNVDVSVLPVSDSYSPSTFAIIIGIIVSIGLLILYFFRQSKGSNGGGGSIFSMGKSRAQVFMPSMIKENFNSVAGATEAKKELQDLVGFLRSPEKFERLGAKMPRGVLLVGEPGTGKTLLARAVAGEAQVPFFSISGSDFMEVFVGVGAARVRDLFAQARKHAPSIIFIDEIDAIGRHRGSGLGSGHDEREQTLNQLLIEMDGFATSGDSVIVIAATNKPDVLDKALLRPGRFDRRVNVPYPDLASRRHMLEILTRTITLAPDVNLDDLAYKTHGFNGADLKNMANKAAMHASKEGKSMVGQADFMVALNQIIQEARTISSTEGKLKLFMPATVKDTFNVFAGAPEVKEELVELVDILKNPEKYRRLGATVSRGVLLDGKPGTGKTLLARAVAGEAQVPFFSASGAEFVEKYVGVGASRVRALFEEARKYAPSIVFIDEIDAIGAKRTEQDGHSEHNQTLNQLLTEMDGFDSRKDLVIVMAATNRKDILDPALLRAGRFDRTIHVPLPNQQSRHAILQVHAQKITLDPEVDLYELARGTPGASGADLANLINEAALCASRHNHEAVKKSDFEEARDRMILGKENRTLMLTDKDKKITAYHEAGHALVGILMGSHMDPLYKVTIIPRGPALGVTHFLPERDKHTENKEGMTADVMTCLGGRIAEQMVFNELGSGAYSDFSNANNLVQKMVRMYGMSEELGQVIYDDPRLYSQATAQKIDEEIRRIMKECYQKTQELLHANRDKLDILANALLDKETIDAAQAYELLGLPPRIVTTWDNSPKAETTEATESKTEEINGVIA